MLQFTRFPTSRFKLIRLDWFSYIELSLVYVASHVVLRIKDDRNSQVYELNITSGTLYNIISESRIHRPASSTSSVL